jgi:hypothetical protein
MEETCRCLIWRTVQAYIWMDSGNFWREILKMVTTQSSVTWDNTTPCSPFKFEVDSKEHTGQCYGYLITFEHQLYNVTPLKTPFGLLLILFQTQSHVTTFTHNYFLRCVTFTQLTTIHVRDYNHLLHCFTFTLADFSAINYFLKLSQTLHLHTSKLSPRTYSAN